MADSPCDKGACVAAGGAARPYLRAGTEEKSGTRPSASVGCVIVISRNTVYGIPAFTANWTVAMISPAPTPKPVNPRIVSSVVLTSTLRNPLVSAMVRVRSTAAIGIFASR